MADRCTGHCCRDFPLSATLEQIRADLENDTLRFDPEEARKLIDMLVPLPKRGEQERFTCRHLDTITGDCLNYENRPIMCRDYPYGSSCSYKECTSDEARSRGDDVLKSKRLAVVA